MNKHNNTTNIKLTWILLFGMVTIFGMLNNIAAASLKNEEEKGNNEVAELTLVVVSLLKEEEERIEIEAKSDASVQEIEEKVKAQLAFDYKYHQLSFKETTLKRDKLISDYEIRDKGKLFIEKRSKVGASFSIPSFEFSNFNHQKEISFVTTAPAWRILCEGLNLEGVCANNSCSAYNKKVWVQKGFGDFYMSKEICESVCPICKKEVKEVKECGFCYCKYHIKGRKVNDEKVDIKDSHDEKTGFRKFLAGGEDSAKYRYLRITVTKHK